MSTIPKILHYIWVGSKPFPADAQAMVDHWKQLMPDYRLMFWTEKNIDFSVDFVRKAYITGAYNRVANYTRYAVLLQHGGIYLDHDVELLKPLDDFLDNACFFGYQTTNAEEKDQVNCAVVGAVPQHPFIGKLLQTLRDEFRGEEEVSSNSGPGLVTRLLQQENLPTPPQNPVMVGDVTLYPARFFYPYPWDEKFSAECITPDTAAIHHWAHTWKRKHTLIARLRQKALRLLARYAPAVGLAYALWRNRCVRKQ